MSSRDPRKLAAQALRDGVEAFWPDKDHWARMGFFMPIMDGGTIVGEAVCLEQLVQLSVQRLVGPPPTEGFRVVLKGPLIDAARLAIIKAAGLGPAPGYARSALIAINDADGMTYEKVSGYVEAAVRELEMA